MTDCTEDAVGVESVWSCAWEVRDRGGRVSATFDGGEQPWLRWAEVGKSWRVLQVGP